ncbi:MAG: hypothetical protein VYB51_06835, partial [Gemmatimonadota bacterium]|nr:hypothetical protein [Gemmatimonadota bacterium]
QYEPQVSADVYIFDRFAPPEAPGGPTLVFLPPDVEWLTQTLAVVEAPEVPGWNPAHPVLRFVALEDLRIDRAVRIAMPEERSVGPTSTVREVGREPAVEVVVGSPLLPLVLVSERPDRIVRVSFALEDSNFPLHPGFPIFLTNTLGWLMDEQVALARPPGQIEVPLAMAAVTDLEGSDVATWPLSNRTVFMADQPGLYTVAQADRRLRVAVNLASTARTSVNDSGFTSDEITSAASTVLADTEVGPNEELWMAFLLLALFLVVVEWVTYHRRLTV